MDITKDFVDERFRAFVIENYCGNRGLIQTSDVIGILSLQIANQGFTSLKGIEHFTSLEELDCSENKLAVLDTSRNMKLKKLSCNKNEILRLDLSANDQLEELDCGFNCLRYLDVSHNPMLTKLVCYWNLLSKLHAAHNINLKELNCSYNSLFDLNLEKNTSLMYLDCGSNRLISLSIKNCLNLIEIRCNHNHLNHLNVSNSPDLVSIRCFNNHLTSLDLSHNPQLKELYCSENKLADLDTSHNPLLERVQYGDNLIVEPDYTVTGTGTFQFDSTLCYYTATLHHEGSELSVTADVKTKPDLERLSSVIRNTWEHIEQLHNQALELIGTIHPDEDVTELVLSELRFDKENIIRLGYDAGVTPAGQLFIYAIFDDSLELNSQLEYETY